MPAPRYKPNACVACGGKGKSSKGGRCVPCQGTGVKKVGRVVHCKRENYDVYIGRPSKWGNPFKIGDVYGGRAFTREDAIDAYEDWLYHSEEGSKLLESIGELSGKVLGCWCAPQRCHGDVLLEALKNHAQSKTVVSQASSANAAKRTSTSTRRQS